MPFAPNLLSPPVRTLLTLALAFVAAELCVWLRIPLPWMIGPLLGTALLTIMGGPSSSWAPFRNAGQWTIGGALGLYFTPDVARLVGGLWWAIALGMAWALALGLGFAAWLRWVHQRPGWLYLPGLSPVTAYFASPIGAASEMTQLSERHGAQPDLVASAHSLRILMVTLIVPFGFQWAGLHGLDTSLPGARVVHGPGLALLIFLTFLGCWLMVRLERANPWFIGALTVSLLLTASGVTLSSVPQGLTNAAQLAIGISLGVRFTPGFVHQAPRWLASVVLATVAMIGLSAGFALVLAQGVGLHWSTLVLATSPGGITEMAITAKVLQLGVPVVTAFHVTRLAGVLLLVEPIYRRWYSEPVPAGAVL